MNDTTTSQNGALRVIIIAGLIVAAFFGAYRFASARGGQAAPVRAQAQTAVAPGASPQAPQPASGGSANTGQGTQAGSGSGCACCGGGGATTSNGVTGAPIAGTAKLSGGIQVIAVKVTTTYSPNIIKLKAGVPAEITFGQGAGCTSQVVSQDLGFSEDLSAGPRTVKIEPLSKGTYTFTCGMGMVSGQIVVE